MNKRWSFRLTFVLIIALGFISSVGLAATDPNLIGWWKFNEGSGAVITDYSIYHNNGTLSGSGSWVAGQGGSAYNFQGAATMFAPLAALSRVSNKVTVAFWARGNDNLPVGSLSFPYMEQFHVSGSNYHIMYGAVQWNPNMSQLQGLFIAGTGYHDQMFDNMTNTYKSSWHYFIYVKDGDTGKLSLYIDGALASSAIGMSSPINSGDLNGIYIGSSIAGGSSYRGAIYDFRIYSKALTYEDISSLWGMYLHKANTPSPADKAVNVLYDSKLSWQASDLAAYHDVYLGTGLSDVNSATCSLPLGGVYKARLPLAQANYDPGPLEFGQTYYWRVDEINGADTWRGPVWSFTVADRRNIDDFESYADTTALKLAWSDTGGSGAVVNLSTDISYDYSLGAMSLHYNNGSFPYFSEVKRIFAGPVDWTLFDTRALGIYFKGAENNVASPMYIIIEDASGSSAMLTYSEPNDLVQFDWAPAWRLWNIRLQDFTGVNLTAVKKIILGVGNKLIPQSGGSGTIYIDNVRLYPQRCAYEYGLGPAGDFDGDCKVDVNDFFVMMREWMVSGEGNIISQWPDENRLLVNYNFNETSGLIANDSSGRNRSASILTGDTSHLWNSSGKNNGCIYFDGDYNTAPVVQVPNSVFYDINGEMTISFWANTDVDAGGQMVLFDSVGTQLAQPVVSPSDPNLKVWYKFDEGSGTTLIDSVASRNAIISDWGSGKTGNGYITGHDGTGFAYNFNGAVSGYLSHANGAGLAMPGGNKQTVAFWFKGNDNIVSSENYPSAAFYANSGTYNYIDTHWNPYLNPNTMASTVLASALGNYHDQTYMLPGSAIKGSWHHLAMVKDAVAGTLTVYLDSVPQNPVTGMSLPITASTGLFIGSYDDGGGCWNGAIDDFRVYDRPLTQAEIAGLMSGDTDVNSLSQQPEQMWSDPGTDDSMNFKMAQGSMVSWKEPAPENIKGAWQHFAIVTSATQGTQKIYHDGLLVAENTGPFSFIQGNSIENFVIGRRLNLDSSPPQNNYAGNYFYDYKVYKGRLDDFRIYNYALSQAQVISLAGLSHLYQPLRSQADLYKDDAAIVNFRDFAKFAEMWLQTQLFPQ